MRGFDFDKALVALQNELHCFAYKLTADKDEACLLYTSDAADE